VGDKSRLASLEQDVNNCSLLVLRNELTSNRNSFQLYLIQL